MIGCFFTQSTSRKRNVVATVSKGVVVSSIDTTGRYALVTAKTAVRALRFQPPTQRTSGLDRPREGVVPRPRARVRLLFVRGGVSPKRAFVRARPRQRQAQRRDRGVGRARRVARAQKKEARRVVDTVSPSGTRRERPPKKGRARIRVGHEKRRRRGGRRDEEHARSSAKARVALRSPFVRRARGRRRVENASRERRGRGGRRRERARFGFFPSREGSVLPLRRRLRSRRAVARLERGRARAHRARARRARTTRRVRARRGRHGLLREANHASGVRRGRRRQRGRSRRRLAEPPKSAREAAGVASSYGWSAPEDALRHEVAPIVEVVEALPRAGGEGDASRTARAEGVGVT